MSSDRIELEVKRDTGFHLQVAFDLPEGGVTVLFGPSGCGKTTVLRSAAGLEHAKGYVRIAGNIWQDDQNAIFVPTYRRRIGYVFQEASLFDHLTVKENISYGLKRIPDENGSRRLHDAVELLGIGHLLDRRTTQLSGGERQRCAIARSLAINPTALFFDEPLAALDRARRLEIMPWLERIKKELSVPILYVTHSEEELMRLADNIVAIDSGSVLASGAVDTVWHTLAAKSGWQTPPSALVIGRVMQRDSAWHLMQVVAGGANFWVADNNAAIGSEIRLRISSENVSLSEEKPSKTSIQNVFEATVVTVEIDREKGRARIELDAGGAPVFADLTAKSAYELGLEPGMRVWAQVKSVAVH